MLVTVNNRLKFEIEIVHDLSCHPIYAMMGANRETQRSSCMDYHGHFQAGLVAEYSILSTTERQQ